MGNLTVTFAPHIRAPLTTSKIMQDVIIALCPALIASVLIFGWRAAAVVLLCMGWCVIFERGFQHITKRPNTIRDNSAALTGLLLAFNLPVGIPFWMAIVGCAVAIILVKQMFGGIGKNFANPALTARIVMFISFPTAMATWVHVDGVSTATPLELMQRGDFAYMPSMAQMLLGTHGGSLGETSAIALLLGGAYLLFRRVITWHIPVSIIGTVVVLSVLLGENPMYHILLGGLLLAAIFMATDYPTSPQTGKGRIIFGIGVGLLTVVIRVWGNFPEGISFAILFMNCLVPYINKFSYSRALGGKRA